MLPRTSTPKPMSVSRAAQRVRSVLLLVGVVCAMGTSLFGQNCTVVITGGVSSICAGVPLQLTADLTGGSFGPNPTITWNVTGVGSVSPTTGATTTYTGPAPQANTTPVTVTATVAPTPDCPGPNTASVQFNLLATPVAGLSASTSLGVMNTSNAYAGQLTFVLCGSPVPASTAVTFTDNSTGGPNVFSLTGDWGSIAMPGGTGNFQPGLQTGVYAVTNSSTGCSDQQLVGVLIGPFVSTLSAQIGINGSQFVCAGEPLEFVLTPTNQNPLGVIYTVHESYDLPPTINPVIELPDVPPGGTTFDHIFSASSCGGTHAGGPNTAGVEVTPAYGCYNGPPVTPITTNGVYVSEPPVAAVSGPTVHCIGIVTFDDISQGEWIDNQGVCHPLPESRYWTLSGGQGTDWNEVVPGALGSNNGQPNTPANWSDGADPLAINFTTPGTYTLTLHVAGNPDCGVSTAEITICIEAPPTPPPFTATPTPGCAPLSVVLDNQGPQQFGCTGGYQWAAVWTGPASACASSGSAVFSNDGPLSYEPELTLGEAGAYSISLVATNSCGASTPTTAIVTVEEPPVVSLPALPANVCEGALVDPSATVDPCGDTDLDYVWTFTSASVTGSTDAAPAPITATLPGPLVIQLEVSNGCGSSVQTVQTTVLPLGGTMTVVADPSPVCLGESVTLTVTDGPSGVPYTWTAPAGGTPSPSSTNVLVNPAVTLNDAGVWNVTAGTGDCDALGQVTVVLRPQPQVTIDPVAPICPSTAVTLQASANGAAGTFVWGDGTTGASYTTPMLFTTTDFTVCFTDAVTGCEECATVQVAVLNAVVADAGPPTLELCDQAIAVPLSGSPVGGIWSITNSGPGTLTEVAGVWTFTPDGEGTTILEYEVDFGVGCSDSDSITVSIGPVIPADPGPQVEVCVSDAAFNMPTNGGGVWTNVLPYFVGGVFNPSLAGVGTFTLDYCVAPGTTCEDCAQVDVIVNGLPGVGPFDDIVTCEGQPAFPLPGPASGWSTIPGILEAGIFNPNTFGTYQPCYTAVDPVTGCEATLCLTVEVDPTPTAQFVANPNPACEQVPVQFTDLSTAGGGGALSSWSWDFGDPNSVTDTSTDPDPEYTYTLAGTYEVELIVAQGNCSDTVASNVVVQAPPTAAFTLENDTVCSNVPVVFTNTSTGTITSYEWRANGNVFSTDAIPLPTSFPAPVCDSATVVITLTVDNESCLPSSTSTTLFIHPQPLSDFILLEDSICSGSAVTVQANNPCAPEWLDPTVTWDWDYDNGPETVAPNNLATVTHVFTNPSYFPATPLIGLTVTNRCGEHTSTRPLVVIADSIAANFTASPVSGCAPLEVAFVQSDLGVTEWQWDYDAPNGLFSSGFSPTHVYVVPGQYVARLVVGNGCVTDTLDRLITAHPPAVVEAFALPDTVCEGVSVEFTSTSVNSNGWTWDFDGAGPGTTGPTAELVFNNSGTYNVSLVVNDISTGCAGSDIVQVEVLDAPEAILNVAPLSGCPPLPVVMESEASNANAIQLWVIEGATEVFSFDAVFTYTYMLPGTHPIRLVALNASGCSDTTRVEVEVFPPVNADFTFTPDSSCITPVSVSFAQQGSGVGPLQYTWDLGIPPTGPSTATAERVYTDPGSYTVCLTMASQDGCADDTCKVLTVLPTPDALMELPPTVCLGSVLDLINNSVNTTGQNWSFGNGAGSSLFEPDYTYPDTGIFQVRLDVVGASGCVDSALAIVTVCGVPSAGFVAEQIIANRYRFIDRSTGADSYAWDFGDGRFSDEAEPEHTFAPNPNSCSWVVIQEVFNVCGCSSRADTTLVAPAEAIIFVANSFSPNGDGQNDTFRPDFPIQFALDLASAGWRFRIFSRWGSEVFFDTDLPLGSWDGTVGEKPVPAGVYQWTLDLNLGCIKDASPFLSGHVTVWR